MILVSLLFFAIVTFRILREGERLDPAAIGLLILILSRFRILSHVID